MFAPLPAALPHRFVKFAGELGPRSKDAAVQCVCGFVARGSLAQVFRMFDAHAGIDRTVAP